MADSKKDPYADAPAALDKAQATLANVHRFRERTRWGALGYRPGHVKRERDIQRKIAKIDAAMKPVRSYIGKLCWHPAPDDLENGLREVSRALQHERKQLKKMRRPS